MGVRQKSIEIKGHGHNSPTPMACRVGPILATSGVSGKNVKTGVIHKDPDQQTKHAFINMASVMKEGGMDMGDIVKMTINITDETFIDSIEKYWTKAYPKKAQSPARHTLVLPSPIWSRNNGARIRLEALAVSKDLK
jgi:2-iminobutanoate/2-iminopropanoate deaminase